MVRNTSRALYLIALSAVAQGAFCQQPTGRSVPELKPLDDLMVRFLREHQVPGAALSVTKGSRLVYARGFGWADREAQKPVQPDSRFRIASISKPITAVAVLQLIEKEELRLEDRVFELVEHTPHLQPGSEPDPRLKNITVRHLLQHAGGWDRTQSFSPMSLEGTIRMSIALGLPPPGRATDMIDYMAGIPLDFEPGSRMAYSNFGYLLLGRVIESVTARSYEDYVKTFVLAPLGIRCMRIGHTAEEQRVPCEVKYYDGQGKTTEARFGPRRGAVVPLPYARCVEIMDAHGGWIASAIDLVRFASTFDDPRRCSILREATVEMMFARSEGPLGRDADGKPTPAFYACGWMVRPRGSRGRNTWHAGRFSGTSTLLVRRHDGLNWAVLFNSDTTPGGHPLSELIDGPLHDAANAVTEWPEIDLFPETLPRRCRQR